MSRLLYQLSEVERNLGQFRGSDCNAARRLIEVEPNGIRGPYALAEVYVRQHNYRDAIATLEAAVDDAAIGAMSHVMRQATRPGSGPGRYQIAKAARPDRICVRRSSKSTTTAIEAYTRGRRSSYRCP